MAITSLKIANFRNLADVQLAPTASGLNIICGNNGSGKTSLLEAIHYLGTGRSFRSSSTTPLINHDTSKFSVFAQILSENERQIPVGVERDRESNTRLRIAEEDVASIAELAYLLPIRVINSQSHNVFEAGPIFRRKFLDWGLFYHEKGFLRCWRQFERALKQRNSVLKNRGSKREMDPWTQELIKYGTELHQMRCNYIEILTPYIMTLTEELLGIKSLEIQYLCGWDEGIDYIDILANNYIDECRAGHTLYGPHRADFDMKIDAVSVKHFLSRGQQKLLICAMILAQGMVLAKAHTSSLIYLVDDLPSELDLHSKRKLISLLSKQHTQIFITSIESEAICDFVENETEVPLKVFHVKHGEVDTKDDTGTSLKMLRAENS